MTVAGIVAVIIAAGTTQAQPASAPPKRIAAGRVVDATGQPRPNVIVFATDAGTDQVVAMASSDGDGRVALILPRRRHNFGILSATLGVRDLVSRGPGRFDLVVTALPAPPPIAASDGVPVVARGATVVRGRVVDETGAPLLGVRLDAVRPTGGLATTGFSGAGGVFAVTLPGGDFRLRPTAPGLVLSRSTQQGERLVIIMTVDAEIQRLTITTGRVLQFRPSDSIDPEYTPPAVVKTWLRYAYGICPSAPLTAAEKRTLRKYWYLDVLRSEPPNPATISTSTCTTPSAYQPTAVPQTGTVGGFDIWLEGVLGQP